MQSPTARKQSKARVQTVGLGQGLRYLSLQHGASQERYPLLLVFHKSSSLQKAQGLKLLSLCLLPETLGDDFISSVAEGTNVYSIPTMAVSPWKRCQAKHARSCVTDWPFVFSRD